MPQDYGDFSDQELAEELEQLDKDMEYWQKTIASHRRMLNAAMEDREDLINIMKQRSQRKGWSK